MTQRVTAVARAAPAAPMAGAPSWPSMRSQLRPAFSRFTASEMTIAGTGRERPSRKKAVARKSSIAGRPRA